MVTKRSIKRVAPDAEDDHPSVPPGFECLTSFTLRKKSTADPMDVDGGSKPGSECSPLSNADIEKFKSSFTQRPWICYGQSDRPPQKCDSDPTEIGTKDPVRSCLPKGVIWGCANCPDCVQVTTRWHPTKEPRLPVFDDAPVFQPTEEEFKDTLRYIAKIRPTAEIYGICRIIPPPSWIPTCLPEHNETSKFTSRVQKIDELRYFYPNRKLSRLHEHIEVKMPRVARNVEHESCNEGMADSEEFENGPEFTLKSFKNCADDFKAQYFCENVKVTEQDQRAPLIPRIEGEYWRIIEKPSAEVKVLCGANLGSGALKGGSLNLAHPENGMSKYVESGWNLNNIPKLSGSLLPFGCYNSSSTMSVPQLFIGMCFASQCWKIEDHHLYSLSYLHLGDSKVCYGVPGRYRFKFVEVVKKLYSRFSKHPKLLHELIPQISPSMLVSEGIPVYRCVQNPMEFVVTFPGAYHAEFCCGFNCAESVCFAPFDWLPHGQNMVELYAQHCLRTSISHDKLLLGAAVEAVKAQWEYVKLKRNSVNNQLWISARGNYGILTRALKSRVIDEGIRRKYLCNSALSSPSGGFDSTAKLECSICSYDLYLSSVSCLCSPNKYSCLLHAKQLCPCPWSSKHFFFRYGMTELGLLVEALEGNQKAIHSWAKGKAQPGDALPRLNPSPVQNDVILLSDDEDDR